MASLGFSYAQAAKGLAPSSNVSSNPESSASSEQGTRDVAAAPVAPVNSTQSKAARNGARTERPSVTAEKPSLADSTGNDSSLQKGSPAAQGADIVTEDNKVERSRKTSQDETSQAPKTIESRKTSVNGIEEQGESSHQLSEVNASQEKARDADDEWEKVSIPSTSTEKDKELKAAPLPPVNFWAQRSQLLQAKLKEQTAQKQTAPSTAQPKSRATVPPRTPSSTDDSKKKVPARENATTDTLATSHTKSGANGSTPRDQQSNHTSPRSTSRQNEKGITQAPPPVDVASWPTPESAIVDAGRRNSTNHQTDRTDLADVKTSRSKAQWTAMPFVPSVKFETQLPSSARRGGRPATTRGRGGASTQADRSTDKSEPGSMGPPPLPKTASDQDRGRKSNATRPARASSVPSEDARTVNVENQQMQDSVSSLKDTTASAGLSSNVSDDRAPDTQTPSSQDPSRSSSRHAPETASAVSQTPNLDSTLFRPDEPMESSGRHSQQAERFRTSYPEGFRSGHEVGDKSQSREWQKDRNNNAQKSDTWRNERRGERSERGRGSYRGRGGHSAYNNPSFTSPLPQNGFDTNKQNSQNDLRNRQASQPYASPFGSTRSNPRSQSIPIHMLQANGFYQPGPAYQQGLPAIQTDINYGAYDQMPTGMPGGIMSAMPYNEQLNGFALISMVVTQLEYYFSLDNLCKDMYLRKNMDSQGYVPLRVIADFRRIKALLGDSSMSYDQLRGVAQQVRNTDYVTGEDGEDRLRSKENWRDFVMPMEERLPQARNDGPSVKTSNPRLSTGMMAEFHMSNGLRSAPPNVNGFHEPFTGHSPQMHFQSSNTSERESTEQWASRVENARQDGDQAQSVTPPVGKLQSPPLEPRAVFGTMTNGHRDSMSSSVTGKESTFPDESVAVLKVVVRDPDLHTDSTATTSDESAATRIPGLRGGAGSPEQLERIRSLQFGQSMTPSKEHSVYFSQGDGLPPPHLVKPGYIHEDYLVLREKALSQRAENHFDGAAIVLYPLWAEFLPVPNQFNVGMYEDFKTWALEDQDNGNENGKKHLVKFYDAMLSGRTAMSERVAGDIVDIARKESGANRPAWLKLRAAWRNGATNMKTRKRLTDLLSAEERAELDKGK